MTVLELDDWQKEVLAYKGDLLLCTGRRVGKTYIMARKAIDRMREEKGTKILMISLTEDQAMIILQMALSYALEVCKELIGTGAYKPTMKSIWVNEGEMIVRPVGNTGDGARGFGGGVLIIDEASRMPEKFWIAARPVITIKGGEIWMASTPFGKQGYFWERFNESYNIQDPEARFKVFYTTTERVIQERKISETWTQTDRDKTLRVLEREKKEMSKLEYGQEFQGLFMEDLQQFFPDEMIMKCQTRKRPDHISPERNYYLGQDIARLGDDETTSEIGYLTGDKIVQVENEVSKYAFLTDTYKRDLELHRLYDFKKMFIDDEGIGIGVFDMLMDNDETRNVVVGINNSKRVIDRDGKEKGILKTELYYFLRMLMEQEKIELLDDASIFQSLKSVQYEYDKDVKGNPIIKIHGNYTHIAEGLTRLAQAMKYKDINIQISYM